MSSTYVMPHIPVLMVVLITLSCGDNPVDPDDFQGLLGTTKIAFHTDRDGKSEIYVMNVDGSNPVNLTNNPAYDSHPAWSPDGSKIAFHSLRNGNYDIYIMNADGSDQKRVTTHPGSDYFPTWSPDGTMLAFESWRDPEKWQIYKVHVDGSNVQKLTDGLHDYQSPHWSPDGSRIMFHSMRGDSAMAHLNAPHINTDMYTIDVETRQEIRITTDFSTDEDAQWSPDGTQIAFSSSRSTPSLQIHIWKAEGPTVKQLTDDPHPARYACWSPDGAMIAYKRSEKYGGDIYIMDVNGSEPIKITDAQANNDGPSWSPFLD